MPRKYKSLKKGGSFKLGRKTKQKRIRRPLSKLDREKRRQRLRNIRPSRRPGYTQSKRKRKYIPEVSRIILRKPSISKYRRLPENHISYIENPHNIKSGNAYPVLADRKARDELQRKTFIIHAHGEMLIKDGNREPYYIPPHINLGYPTSCGQSFVIPNHQGRHSSLMYIDEVCQNKFNYAWIPGGNVTDNSIFSNYKANPRTFARLDAPIFDAGIYMCDLTIGYKKPRLIYNLEDGAKHLGILATASKLTLKDVVNFCQSQCVPGELFDIIIATCWSPSPHRNIETTVDNIAEMLEYSNLNYNNRPAAAAAAPPSYSRAAAAPMDIGSDK